MPTKRLTAIIFFSLMLVITCVYPNIAVAISMSNYNQNIISPGWQEACLWLKDNTTEPSNYYDLNAHPSWGVMSWWDYGYWITREGQRPAMCNPGSDIRYDVARLLVSDNYSMVHDILVSQKIKYVVIDYLMVTSKFYAIHDLATAQLSTYHTDSLGLAKYGTNEHLFQQDYEYWDKDQGQPVMLYYEDYYKSLAVRLYNYNGQPVRSPGTPVYQADQSKNITAINDFPDLPTAQAYQSANGGIIAGSDPFLSPYALSDNLTPMFNLVWESNTKVKLGDWIYPEVKIYEVK